MKVRECLDLQGFAQLQEMKSTLARWDSIGIRSHLVSTSQRIHADESALE